MNASAHNIASNDGARNVLDVKNLRVRYDAMGETLAVDGIDFVIPAGQTLALVGDSGSGKTTVALSLLGLIPRHMARVESGEAWLVAKPDDSRIDLLAVGDRHLRRVRGAQVAMVFQDPGAALNPVLSVGAQVVEAIQLHQPASRRTARRRAATLLERVGLPDPNGCLRAYPHQLSGGMQQRVMIAMALACDPVLLIADEPTSALDVTTQVRILALLSELQRVSRMAMLFITHDLGIVARMADRVCVMESGRIVERGATQKMLEGPQHACTQRLLQAAARFAPRASLQVN